MFASPYDSQVYIDERFFYVSELVEYYSDRRLVFPSLMTRNEIRRKKDKEVKAVIEAFGMGIPYPVIYFIEMDTGEYLVLEKRRRLEGLLLFICGEFQISSLDYRGEDIYSYYYDLDSFNRREIVESKLLVRIIRYSTPKYLQMLSTRYLCELTVAQEQVVRRIIYDKSAINDIQYSLEKLCANRRGLKFEYEVIVYLTIYYNYIKEKKLKENHHLLMLQEIMLQGFLNNENELYELISHYIMIRDVIFNQMPKGRESLYFLNLEKKYPNFVPIYGYIIGVIEAAFGNKLPDERVSTEMHKLYTDLIVRKDVQLVKMFDDYDMSSIALENLIKEIRGYSND